MTSARSAMLLLIVFVTLLCTPPLLGLRSCLKRAGYLRAHGRTVFWPLLGAAFSAASGVVNLAIAVALYASSGQGDLVLGPIHAFAFVLSWACLCLWIFMAIAFHHHGRMN